MFKHFNTVKEAREYTRLSQSKFSILVGMNCRTIQAYEQGSRHPDEITFHNIDCKAWQYKHHVVVLKDKFDASIVVSDSDGTYIGVSTAEELYEKLKWYAENDYNIEWR